MTAMGSPCATAPSPLVSAPSACPSSKNTAAAIFRRRRTVSCKATGGRDNNDGLLWLPRRDVMLNSLSGVAAGLAWYPGLVSAAEDSKCPNGADKVNDKVLRCTNATEQPCPPQESSSKQTDPVDFNPVPGVPRVRKPVHGLDPEGQEKYKEAVRKMKELDEKEPSNPLSFRAQAAIHQAYCDSYYKYVKSPGTAPAAFDVHFTWIFAPWHRMYIYFYEKALGDLIGDSSFALPFWNWDAPAGMVVPELFRDRQDKNPLYDPNRNEYNLDKLMDLNYFATQNNSDRKDRTFVDPQPPGDKEYSDLVNTNLCTICKQQQAKESADSLSFLGGKYCADLNGAKRMGSLESMAHTSVHVWTGRRRPKTAAKCSDAIQGAVVGHDGLAHCEADMGFLGTAANDPLFYSHHSNVDRMWHLWSTRLGGGNGFADREWLDTSFVFYDNVHSPRKVRIKVRDVLDTAKLGYTYDPEHDKDLPWLNPDFKRFPKNGSSSPPTTGLSSFFVLENPPMRSRSSKPQQFPLTLVQNQVEEVLGVAVPPREEGKEQLLVLVIDGIEFDPQVNNKFDVAINVPKDKALQVGPQYKEYAGTFAVVPGSGGGATRPRQGISICITDVLADIEAAGDSTVDVVIVPRTEARVTLNARPTIQNRK